MKILYEDPQILVCVKPAGIATETKRIGQQDMVSLLRHHRVQKGEGPYIGLVHRLDQPVEGLLVFGKDPRSSASLSRQVAKGFFSKQYLAVTQGELPAKEGRLTDYLKKDGRSNISYITNAEDPMGKRAELIYKVLETETGPEAVLNLVQIQLLTGRHHQIRVQMAHLGTPLVQDTKYGAAALEGEPWGKGIALCAYSLKFLHPATKKEVRYTVMPSHALFQRFEVMQDFGSSAKM